MLKTFSSICLLTLILISLVSTTSILLQQHHAAAEGLFQKRYPHVTFVHANTNDILANNNNSTTNIKLQNSTPLKTTQKEQAAVKNFQEIFCGANIKTTPAADSNGYVTENTLPQNCEMPLGIAVDNNAHRAWYVSTKKGVLGSYDLKRNTFDSRAYHPQLEFTRRPIWLFSGMVFKGR